MQADHFYRYLQSFISRHGIDSTLPSRKKKLTEEYYELCEAIESGNKVEIIKEACDVAIVCFHIMFICGCVNPLWHMFLKLEEVSARPEYQAMARRGDHAS